MNIENKSTDQFESLLLLLARKLESSTEVSKKEKNDISISEMDCLVFSKNFTGFRVRIVVDCKLLSHQ